MRHQTKKSPTSGGGSGKSKVIHIDRANDLYLKLLHANNEADTLCAEFLSNFDALLEKHWVGDIRIPSTNRLRLYHCLVALDKRGLK